MQPQIINFNRKFKDQAQNLRRLFWQASDQHSIPEEKRESRRIQYRDKEEESVEEHWLALYPTWKITCDEVLGKKEKEQKNG
jgi:hypothetical protein